MKLTKSEVIWDGGEHQVKQSFISIAILIIILVTTVYFVSKVMRYKTEREKSAIKKSFIAYLLTEYIERMIQMITCKADYNFQFVLQWY